MKLEKVVRNLILGSILACLAHVWAQKDFLWVLSLLLFISDVKHCYKLCVFKENIQTKEIEKKIKKKTYFAPDLGPLGPNLGHYFFFQNQALSVTRYYGQLSSCKLSEKTNDSILFEK